jgi:molybdate transport system substrate-binding protein
MRLRQFSGLLIFLLAASGVRAEEINIAVASNFTAAMREIVEAFEQTSGHQVKLSFGSSGKFFAQIQHGAPYQAFFSADQAKPVALEAAGQVVPGSRFTYAIGALALWSPKTGFIEGNAQRLHSGAFNKLALANPRLAPYGAAAIEVLEKLECKEATREKWVQGENISQTYQFVRTGNAELGFVALSQIMQQGEISQGSWWLVPSELYSPIRQDAVVLKGGKDSAATQALMQFIRGEQAGAIISAYGYHTAQQN